jgi:hypothetical protein
MTYTPPPQNYSHYPGYIAYQPDPLAPARRASVMMFVLGALSLLMGACSAGVGAMIPQMLQQPDFAAALAQNPEISPQLLQTRCVGFGILSLVFGMALIVLGVFVRRGGPGPIIGAIVVTSLALLIVLLNTIGPIVSPRFGAQLGGVICMGVVALALLVLLLVWLIQAARAAPHVRLYRAQYAAGYWQYQQPYAAGPYAPPPPMHPPFPTSPPTSPPPAPPAPPPPPTGSP